MDLPVERPVTATEGRLMSLDALRGFDMFWIVGGHAIVLGLGKSLGNEWVNQHVLPQIQHVPWEGFTAWDLIMPLFLFMVGTNAIAAYMVTRVFDFRHVSDIFIHGLAKWTGPWHGFVQALAAFAVLRLILWLLYHRCVFIKI